MTSVSTMILLNGEPITDDDARSLVDLLLRSGGADAASAAAAINTALDTSADAVDLSAPGCAAVMHVLSDELDTVLANQALSQERRQREGSG